MKDNLTINEFLAMFTAGDFESPDVDTQIKAGWYDWFCNDNALKLKTYALTKKLIQILKADKGKLIDRNKCYVFFKNNCPMVGKLYDSFSICDMETNNVLFWVSPNHDGDLLAGKINDEFETIVKNNWEDVLTYFKKG